MWSIPRWNLLRAAALSQSFKEKLKRERVIVEEKKREEKKSLSFFFLSFFCELRFDWRDGYSKWLHAGSSTLPPPPIERRGAIYTHFELNRFSFYRQSANQDWSFIFLFYFFLTSCLCVHSLFNQGQNNNNEREKKIQLLSYFIFPVTVNVPRNQLTAGQILRLVSNEIHLGGKQNYLAI